MQTFGTVIYIGVLLLIFYLWIMRPQQKRVLKHKELIDSIKSDDQVVTAGGIYGKVIEVHDKTVILNIASEVNIELSKQAIVSRSS